MKATFEPGGRGAPGRRDIMALVGPQLAGPVAAALTGLWKDAIRASSAKGRSHILTDIVAFSGPLVTCFGPAVAESFDGAIRAAGVDRWP
jgi:hypothetical protein